MEAAEQADVLAVHVDVHEPAQLADLVEEQVGDGQLPERVLDGRRLDLEPPAPARLRRQERR